MAEASPTHPAADETCEQARSHALRLQRDLQRLRDDLAARGGNSPDSAEGLTRLAAAIDAARDVAAQADLAAGLLNERA